MNKHLWEILVPHSDSNGRPFATIHHLSWDDFVARVAGGLTLPGGTILGRWQNVKEKMIRVRVLATRSQMRDIVDFTLEHYKQKAVLAYKISDEYIYEVKTD